MDVLFLPELGQFALILALVMAVVQALLPMIGSFTRQPLWLAYAQPAVWAQFTLLTISFLMLTASFLLDDFSVAYVAANSNSALPWYYKMSAVWGAHEGSLLLWLWILAGWTFAVSLSRGLPVEILARVLSVLGFVSIGMMLFVVFTSNPFDRFLPRIPADGADLNPLLQDPGLIFHPPLLYMGYVGFAVTFAFALAALWTGQLDSAWARWSRPWTTTAWAFLTSGIALGSWWAYYELGWGGWWFWDPVENASLMPWLTGTALMHSLAVTEKRGVFKSWTLLLAIATFSLSLVGFFLVRSGVLNSVHAFANDPDRGFFLLVLLAVTVGVSLLVYAIRVPNFKARVSYSLISKDVFLLANNILLVVACITVLLGTLYPLVLDALGKGKISVGPPYFNALFVPQMLLLGVFMGLGPLTDWKAMQWQKLRKKLWLSAAITLVLGFALLPWVYDGQWSIWVALGLTLFFWVMTTSLRDIWEASRGKQGWKGITRSRWGMFWGHVGAALIVLGVTMVSNYGEERDVRMAVGETVVVKGYQFTMTELTHREGPNFIADRAIVEVRNSQGRLISTLTPEKRLYVVRGMPMTQVAIDWGLLKDIYVAMGEELSEDAWAMRVHYKPFVRWLWLGAFIASLGGILAISDRRYRMRVASVPVNAGKTE
ncbi:heme lyase CcmF/NrfE family subunit [Marinospirillum alkaliphilum]|uniref:Cytochrome c-type biogenesis protein CcmF n=1 Tax=Marinospirillum alkaliphilum DSM 21637 TaxID=1122209 RepID=A0A1K1VCH0_9GAMM|nr:heme lyase CcmF/NrfE family subunit [Marinospirillum alkaliphilum]SFX22826.1 cytochrome c-type biogenesis protein CcmF [Marinospirillum alkaliphilum DSM 21637]